MLSFLSEGQPGSFIWVDTRYWSLLTPDVDGYTATITEISKNINKLSESKLIFVGELKSLLEHSELNWTQIY